MKEKMEIISLNTTKVEFEEEIEFRCKIAKIGV